MDSTAFLQIEKKYELCHAEFLGVNTWVYYRPVLWNYVICQEKLDLKAREPLPEKTGAERLRQGFRCLAAWLLEPLKLPRRVDVLFLNHERRAKIGAYYDCLYTEELNRCFRYTATIEDEYRGGHLRPTRTPNLIYADLPVFKARVRKKLYTLRHPELREQTRGEIAQRLGPALRELKEVYGCSFGVEEEIDNLCRLTLRFAFERDEYKRLLHRLKPKIIVEVVHYSFAKMMMNEIAKDMGIPTVELQHGTIYEEHIAYQYLLPETIKQFPDYIFLFSAFWKNRMQAPIADAALIPTGYPHFEAQLNTYMGRPRGDERTAVLFVSQLTIGKQLSDLACRLSALLDREKYRLVYKLHPTEYGMWKDAYPQLRSAQIEVVSDSALSLYQLFAESDVQIGVYSTAIYEGLGFGLKTLILKTGHYDAMLPLVDKGYARLIEDERDALRAIEEKWEAPTGADALWMSGAAENILREITKICPAAERKTPLE